MNSNCIKYVNDQATTSSYRQNERLQVSQQEELYPLEKSLYVYPLPSTLSRKELLHFFREFGSIKRHLFVRKSLIIEYFDSTPVNILLSRKDWLQHEELYLRRKIDGEDFTNVQWKYPRTDVRQPKIENTAANLNKKEEEEDFDPIRFDCISHVFKNVQTFDEQLKALLYETELTYSEAIARYDVVCPHLEELCKSVFPDCRTLRFGSTITGLGFKDCDLDIYMHIGTRRIPQYYTQPNVPADKLTTFIFTKIKKLMYRMTGVFSNIVTIPKAKTPIIKFRYLPTNVSCDITFKNCLGIYKSNFLKYCASHDIRSRPLIMLIKYWARHLKISGVGKISSYELISLIIFYLQQVDILPPLLELQQNCEELIIEGWQVNFNQSTPISPTSNSSTIPELLHEFFVFYSKFNFKNQVLCLLDGKVHPVSKFTSSEQLPSYMERYKTVMHTSKRLDTDKPMCVQDPIELNQNSAAITPSTVLTAFQECCQVSAEICAATKPDNYTNLLGILFTSEHPQVRTKSKKKNKILDFYVKMETCVKFLDVGLPEDFEQRTDINKQIYKENNWFYIIWNLIKHIFEMVFKFQVDVIEEKDVSDIKELFGRTSVTLQCSGNKCLWKNRKKNTVFLDVYLSELEKEVILSNKLLECSNCNMNKIILEFNCLVIKQGSESELKSVDFCLTYGLPHKETFRQFSHCARSLIQRVVEKTLIHMLQYKKDYNQLLHNITQCS